MSSEWSSALIDEIKSSVQSSIAIGPFGSRMKSDCYVEDGIRVVRGTNISSGRTFTGDFVFITPEKAKELGGANLQPNDLVFPHRGSIGEVGVVPNDGKKYVISSSLMKLTCDTSKALPLFVYYFFKSDTGKFELLKNSSQVGTPGIGQPLTSLKSISIPLPPMTEQKEIANFLGSIDDRIALLHETNATLEAIAQALFKSWFVDFDPVHAKQQGLMPEGMDEATAALFPDGFEESELGLIPTGWTVSTFKNITTKIGSGATPRGGRDVYLDEGVAFIRSQNVYDSKFVWDGLVHISDMAALQLNGVEVKKHDVLLNITGASILRTCVVDPEVLPARVNQHVAIIRAKPFISARYIHLHLLQQKTKNYLMALNSGASREAIIKSHIENLPILNPGLALNSRFQEVVSSIYQKVEQMTAQSRTLANIRDTLLPRLISGQLRIPEAETLLEEVI